MSIKCTSITKEAFDRLLSRYASLVPPALSELDTVRYEETPASLRERSDDMDGPYLTRKEVERLVEWKLKHGTFRPKLLQLVQSNPVETVETTTRKAFAADGKDALAALKTLTALKGIGPATASLLLSVHRMEEIPFFSDELFRWLMWDEPGAPGGWKRAIKYNIKEYQEVLDRAAILRKRLNVGADGCEKVAWVLGKEGIDLDSAHVDAETEAPTENKMEATKQTKQVSTPKPATKPSTKERKAATKDRGTKRKVVDDKVASEGVRKSSRRRTHVSYGEE